MRALFDYVAVVHHEDEVGFLYRRQTVRDDKTRPALHHCAERALDLDLRARVDRRRRFVEDKHRRMGQHYARYAQKLFLSLRQVVAAFGYHRVVALFHLCDKAVCVCRFCRRDYLFVSRVALAVGDVLLYRTARQPRLLKHHSEALAQAVALDFGDGMRGHDYAPVRHVVIAHEQVDKSGFAATRRSDDRDLLSVFNCEIDVLQKYPVFGISEAHVFEPDRAVAFSDFRESGIVRFGRLVEYGKDAARARHSGLKLRDDACYLVERFGVLV